MPELFNQLHMIDWHVHNQKMVLAGVGKAVGQLKLHLSMLRSILKLPGATSVNLKGIVWLREADPDAKKIQPFIFPGMRVDVRILEP